MGFQLVTCDICTRKLSQEEIEHCNKKAGQVYCMSCASAVKSKQREMQEQANEALKSEIDKLKAQFGSAKK
jgi:hypothetical protein